MLKDKLPNERVAMMSVARDIVGMLFHRDHPGENGFQEKRQLNAEEQNLYTATIRFLTKEFNIGHRETSATPDKDLPQEPTGKSDVPAPVQP